MEENKEEAKGAPANRGRPAGRPYRVNAKALEAKGFKTIRYDRHEAYAKEYALEGRAFVGTVNPVTGDRAVNKVGAFASARDIDLLRTAWDMLTEDVVGPRHGTAGGLPHAPREAAAALPPDGLYSYRDLTSAEGAAAPRVMTADEVSAAVGASDAWKAAVAGSGAGGKPAEAAPAKEGD